ncbi:MAG TPA: tail fiber domain-containing protein [Flavobacterium sp.]|jgi:hypothetical protein
MKKFIALLCILFKASLYAQIGIGTTTPNAAIEVSSSNDGFLLPRIALLDKNTARVLTPTVSEIIYNTATSGVAPNNVRPGFYFWTGTSWMELDNTSYIKNWEITGNGGKAVSVDFVGTTDNTDFNFRRFNIKSGILGTTNTAFGFGSLLVNTAVGITAFGTNALANNTNATGNTAFGYGALQDNSNNTFGNIDNTAFGFEALRYNNVTTFFNPARAKGNTAIGPRVLRANTRGYNNTAIGPNALTNCTTGALNTAIGTETLIVSNTGSNTALGSEALRNNSSGGDNTAFGRSSAVSNTTGFNIMAAGSNALPKNINGNRSTVFGYKAEFENAQGTDHTVAGALAMENANLSNNSTLIGYKAWGAPPSIPPVPELSSSYSVGIGSQCLTSLTSSSFNIGIGQGAEVAYNTSNRVRIGNTAIIYAGVQVPWTITSDRRWKSNIKNSDLGLDFVKKLNPISYIRKNDENKKLEYGFIAQELEQALHESKVADNGIISKADDGMLSVRYNDLLSPMVKAIQQQQVTIEKLTARIKELEKNRIKR